VLFDGTGNAMAVVAFQVKPGLKVGDPDLHSRAIRRRGLEPFLVGKGTAIGLTALRVVPWGRRAVVVGVVGINLRDVCVATQQLR